RRGEGHHWHLAVPSSSWPFFQSFCADNRPESSTQREFDWRRQDAAPELPQRTGAHTGSEHGLTSLVDLKRKRGDAFSENSGVGQHNSVPFRSADRWTVSNKRLISRPSTQNAALLRECHSHSVAKADG